MKLAIMQPYIFPYVGYFQLIAAADKFVIYDDVNFIKQGWINRNNILLNNERHLFTIPVENLTSFKRINEIKVASNLYEKWLGKFCKTIHAAYRKAPNFDRVYPLVLEVFEKGREAGSLCAICTHGINLVCDYLGIGTVIESSSAKYGNEELHSYQRVIDICKREGADVYINAIGGQELYSKEVFAREAIDLHFLQTNDISYNQYNGDFVPHLSIIDLMMFNPKEEIRGHIQNFNLI